MTARRHIHFAADDRLDAALLRFKIKLHRAIKNAVIGERDSRHSEFGCRGDDVADAASAVEQRILAMNVQMNEILSQMTAGFDPRTSVWRLLEAILSPARCGLP